LNKTPDKILVVRLSSIGDIILTTPLLRCIRKQYPRAEITYLVKKQFTELLSSSPYVDKVISFDSKTGFRGLQMLKKKLREEKFDLFLDVHKNLRSLYLKLFLSAKKNSYSKDIIRRTLLIWFRINLFKNVKPVYLKYFESVEDYNIKYDGEGTEVHFPREKAEIVRRMLYKKGYHESRPVVVICPAATYMNKKWLPERFAETASSLVRLKGAFVVVHGGKGDETLCSGIVSQAGERVISLAGMLSLSETAALLSMAGLVIANDSGLLHLAQSQKVPVIGIYGATSRELGFFPVEGNSRVIETALSCRPCTHKGLDYCPRKHFRCMQDISAERVIAAAAGMI